MEEIRSADIAIVGMAGRFPGAADIAQYWDNIAAGRECIRTLSDDELYAGGVPAFLYQQPHYIRASGVLDGADRFDAAFFGFSPSEAELIDPQHRLFLEQAWTVIEQAGYDPETYGGAIGVYAGVGLNSYLLNCLYPHLLMGELDSYQVQVRNDKDFLPTLVSYKLNLRGPSLSVQTACSTSLVAVHLACQSLLSGECDMALAGGVTVYAKPTGYLYTEGMILSPDGHCRAFDAQAHGTVDGNGVGVVVLKRLVDAIDDGDTIHAVIKGSAINNDGANKVGYTAPSVEGQAAVIMEAQALAETPADTIAYIETHGTGTPLGDPIELSALIQAFRASTTQTGFCAIGSVKPNIGHLDTAAGVASLIKAVQALKHHQLPPSINVETPNPAIHWSSSPFFVNTSLAPWERGDTPRRAGVSAFGIGGTNAHLVLEEAPVLDSSWDATPRRWHLLTLSAKTATALEQSKQNLIAHLRQQPTLNLADVAYTLGQGRKGFAHRHACVVETVAAAIAALESPEATHTVQRPAVAFLFPGQGAQYLHMAQNLYKTEPIFQEAFDRCTQILLPLLGKDVRSILYPNQFATRNGSSQQQNGNGNGNGRLPQGMAAGVKGNFDDGDRPIDMPLDATSINETQYAQPLLFTVEYALAQLWLAWGIEPDAMLGHSLGEYVAACLAGVFTLEDALKLVAQRAKLMQQLVPGAMLVIPGQVADIQLWLSAELELAADNGGSCTVSGSVAAIVQLEATLSQQGITTTRLQTRHAFHSQAVEPILSAFRQCLNQVPLRAPDRPYLSTVTGDWVTAAEVTDPDYWIKQLRQPVQFGAAVTHLLAEPNWLFLEVGPGRALSSLVRRHPHYQQQPLITSLCPLRQSADDRAVLTALSKLWLHGIPCQWSQLYPVGTRHRIPLPTYPFERERFWLEPPKTAMGGRLMGLLKNPEISQWFYTPVWNQLPLSPPPASAPLPQTWLIFLDDLGLGAAIATYLKQTGHQVVTVERGQRWWRSSHSYQVAPGQPSAYLDLLQRLQAEQRFPDHILHLWSLTPSVVTPPKLKYSQTLQELGLYSLLALAQALGKLGSSQPLQLSVITSGLYSVMGTEALSPLKSTLLGAVKVMPQEYPQLRCCCLDLDEDAIHQGFQPEWQQQLLADLQAETLPLEVAYRGHHRWVPGYASLPIAESLPARLRPQGVYLITGGLGGIGLTLAMWLAQTVQARLVLVTRSAFVPKKAWQTALLTYPSDHPTHRKIRQLLEIERSGGQVWVQQADVTNVEQMSQVVSAAEAVLGQIHGVIHCAGLPDFAGMIQGRSQAQTESILAAKVTGTLVLDQVFRQRPLDFWVFSASLSTTLYKTMFGQVGYCAANDFLNAFCDYKNRIDKTYAVTIAWTEWEDVGMAVDARETRAKTKANVPEEENWLMGLTPAEGAAAFARIFSQTAPKTGSRVIVSTQDLNFLLTQQEAWQTDDLLDALTAAATTDRPKHPRPALDVAYQPPQTLLESRLIALWEGSLGIAPIGTEDSFYDLGGDSLMALGLLNQMQKQLAATVPLTVLLEQPTVTGVANHLITHNPEAIAALLSAIVPIEPPPKEAAKAIAPDLHPDSPFPDEPDDVMQHSELAFNASTTPHPSPLTPHLSPLTPHPSPLEPIVLSLRPGSETATPLFFVHPIGGGISCYTSLARQLDSAWTLYGIRAVGLEDEAPPYDDVRQMATLYRHAVQRVQPHGPYALGGWSMGGVVAYEMLLQLLQTGETVTKLILLDSPAPVAAARDSQTDFLVFAQGMGFLPEQVQSLHKQSGFATAPLNSQLARLLTQGQSLGLLPALSLPAFQQLYHVFHHHSQALSTYHADRCPQSISTLLLQASDTVPFAILGTPDRQIWQRLLGRVQVQPVPGDHYSMVAPPHVSILAKQMNAFLQGDRSPSPAIAPDGTFNHLKP